MIAQPTLGFIGAGKVGTTLARLLYERGYVIQGVQSRNPEHAERLATAVHAKAADSANEVIELADLTFLTVPDDAVRDVVSLLANGELRDKGIVHTSGVHEADELALLATHGAMIGSLHPIYPFASVEDAISDLSGSVFGLQTDSSLLNVWLEGVVSALGGQTMIIGAGQKALYHTALIFASNFGVTLYAIAQQLLCHAGAENEVSSQALNSLMAGMVRNLQVVGLPNALTGPLVRGDTGTIGSHLAALQLFDPALADLYLELAVQTLPLVTARGIDTSAVEAILRRKLDDADNHT